MTVLDAPRVDTIILDETILDETASCTFDDNPAVWIAGCRRCPRHALWCADHHDRKMVEARNPSRVWLCRDCGNESRTWQVAFYKRPV
jgi:hypothetical protein